MSARRGFGAVALLRALALPCLACGVAACGFHLVGAGALPGAMARTYLDSTEPHSDFSGTLTEALRLRGSQIVDSREEAGAVLSVIEDSSGQRVLSVSARNTPREYEIFYSVTFSLEIDGERMIEPESLTLTRSYTYDETQVLGKDAEEDALRLSLARDLARQVVRRIEAVQANPPVPGA